MIKTRTLNEYHIFEKLSGLLLIINPAVGGLGHLSYIYNTSIQGTVA